MPALARAIAVLLLTTTSAHAELSGRATVVDGDGIKVGKAEVRLSGIDAFEYDTRCNRAQTCPDGNGGTWACGKAGKDLMARLIKGWDVHCTVLRKGPYGRLISNCTAGGEDISRAMIDAGLAIAYRRYSKDYVPAELDAERRKVGIWRAPRAQIETPEDFRRRVKRVCPKR